MVAVATISSQPSCQQILTRSYKSIACTMERPWICYSQPFFQQQPVPWVLTQQYGHDILGMTRVSVTSIYSIAAAGPGSGKSVAFRLGLHKPLAVLEEEGSTEWMLKDFTKQGILKQQDESEGKGIIASDEVYGVLNQCLLRSEAGVASTGERQLLCSFWSGDGHSTKYATKSTVKVTSSALCLGGFTQPDKLHQLVQTLGSSNDGLLDRMLLWACRKKVYYCSAEEVAYQELQREGGGVDFTNVLRTISNLHEHQKIVYRFSADGFGCIRNFRDELARRILDPQDEEKSDIPSMANQTFHTRYVDHLYRLAVSLHILYSAITANIQGQILLQFPEEIPTTTLLQAKALLDYLTLQKSYIIQGALGVSTIAEEKVTAPSKQQDSVYIEMTKKMLTKPGPGFTFRDAKRAVTSKAIPIDVLFMRMEGDGLGTVVDSKRSKIFYKNPKPADDILKTMSILKNTYDAIRKAPGTLTQLQVQSNPYKEKIVVTLKRKSIEKTMEPAAKRQALPEIVHQKKASKTSRLTNSAPSTTSTQSTNAKTFVSQPVPSGNEYYVQNCPDEDQGSDSQSASLEDAYIDGVDLEQLQESFG